MVDRVLAPYARQLDDSRAGSRTSLILSARRVYHPRLGLEGRPKSRGISSRTNIEDGQRLSRGGGDASSQPRPSAVRLAR